MMAKSIKRVGIMTLYFNYNYGAVLQAYALQKVMRHIRHYCPNNPKLVDEEYDVKDIRYLRKVDQTVSEPSPKTNLRKKLRKLFGREGVDFIQNKIKEKINRIGDIKRKQMFDAFVKRYIAEYSLPPKIDIRSLNEQFDIFCAGSDNIWNCHLFDGRFMLDFVDDDKIKIAYAPGMSTESLSPKQEEVYKHNALRFNAISCREKNGARVLSHLLCQEVFVALDPTLLLSAEEWDYLGKRPSEQDISNKYVLCYFCAYNKYSDEYVTQLIEKTGLSFIAVPNMGGEFNLTSKQINRFRNVGPQEILYLFNNATYVLTDSFHGTVFALHFKKQFLCFRRFFDKKNNPLNYRIDNLLDIAGIDNKRIIIDSGQNILDRLYSPIDWAMVNNNLSRERDNSLFFLSEALTLCNRTNGQ